MATVSVNVPLNRVEGDLEIRAVVENMTVKNAWASGTMFRGIERILEGRGALDGLVITPRICGICCTSHLTAAVGALDRIANVTPPPDAVRVRNVALMTEDIQSDVRHAFLLFAPDFLNPAYKGNPLFDEAVRRYTPFKGDVTVETIKATKKVLGIVAVLGGQWPHTSFMVPGGITSTPARSEIVHCLTLLRDYRDWYERRVLGCTIERWKEVRNTQDLENWLGENPAHHNGELGFFFRFSHEAHFDRIGAGRANFLSYGALPLPPGSAVAGTKGQATWIPAGFFSPDGVETFDQSKIAEHVAASWYIGEEGAHPFDGETEPYATGQEHVKYSWAKAPRYGGRPAETGPLAEMLVSQNPLVTEMYAKLGVSVFLRQFARLTRPAEFIPVMETWLSEISGNEKYYTAPDGPLDGEGFGLTHAARGALGHWVKVKDGVIEKYQVITPTGWNVSPRDGDGVRGPIEEALVGAPVKDAANPVELGHIVRSFDPCLVCTVHTVTNGKSVSRLAVG